MISEHIVDVKKEAFEHTIIHRNVIYWRDFWAYCWCGKWGFWTLVTPLDYISLCNCIPKSLIFHINKMFRNHVTILHNSIHEAEGYDMHWNLRRWYDCSVLIFTKRNDWWKTIVFWYENEGFDAHWNLWCDFGMISDAAVVFLYSRKKRI